MSSSVRVFNSLLYLLKKTIDNNSIYSIMAIKMSI